MNDLELDLNIDPTDLDDEITRQPGRFAKYAQEHAQAEKQAKHAKLQLDVFEAALDKKIRDRAAGTGKKLSEKMVDSLIKQNDEWIERKKALHEAEAVADQIKAIVEGMRQKKDMLVTFCANARQEMGSNFSMKGNANQQYEIPLIGTDGSVKSSGSNSN